MYACIVGAVVVLDFFIGSPLKTRVQSVFTPIVGAMHELTTQRLAAYLVSKEALRRENVALQLKVSKFEQNELSLKIVTTEAGRFCAIHAPDAKLNNPENTDGTHAPDAVVNPGPVLEKNALKYTSAVGRVIAYDRIVFGKFIVLFSDERRPKVGDYVLDDAGYPLGLVEVVRPTDAVVTLLTMMNTTHEVKVGKIIAQAHGKLSNTFTVHVPQEAEVEVGDIVTHVGLNTPLGSVVSIERSPADAQIQLYVRPYSRPMEARYVTFIENTLREPHE